MVKESEKNICVLTPKLITLAKTNDYQSEIFCNEVIMDIGFGISYQMFVLLFGVSLSSSLFRLHGTSSRCKEGRFLYIRDVKLRNRNGSVTARIKRY